MRTNPLFDSLKYIFVVKSWMTIAFDVLLPAGIALAIRGVLWLTALLRVGTFRGYIHILVHRECELSGTTRSLSSTKA